MIIRRHVAAAVGFSLLLPAIQVPAASAAQSFQGAPNAARRFSTLAAALVTPGDLSDAEVVDGELPLTDPYSRASVEGGTVTRDVYSVPVNFRDTDGAWQEIDPSLEASQSSAFAAENGDNAFDALLPRDAGETPVRLESGETWLTFRSVGADGAPELDGSAASYEGPVEGSTLTYDVTTTGVKETVTLAEAPALAADEALRLAFRLDLSAGLTPELRPNGSVVVRDVENVVQYVVPAPVMFDSGQTGSTPAYSDAIETTLVRSGTSWVLRLTPSRDWLSNPSRVYPVMIDPTVNVRTDGSSIDCWIGEDVPNTSACSSADTYLWAGRLASGDRRRSLLYFDLSTIPSNATVSSGTVKLYYVSSKRRTNTTNNYGVRRINASYWNSYATWTKRASSANWANAGGDYDANPAPATTAISGSAVSGTQEFAATSIVQSWFPGPNATPAPNRGLLLRAFSETTDQAIAFSSSGSSDVAKYPQLEVKYKAVPTVTPKPDDCQSPCQAPYVMTKASPTFIAQTSNPTTTTASDDIAFQVREQGAASTVASGSGGTVDSSGRSIIQIPDAVLSTTKTYEIRVGARENQNDASVVWGDWVTFSIYLTPGAPTIVSMAPCVGPCTNWVTDSATPTFGASATDDSPTLNFHFRLFDASNNVVKSWDVEKAPTNEIAAALVPVASITASGTYKIQAGVDDSTPTQSRSVVWGPTQTFSANLAAPNPTIPACVNGAIEITSQVSWTPQNSPYIVRDCPVRIRAGGELTIEPGTIVKLDNPFGFQIYGGSLRALGSANSPVIFAPLSDDRVGGDTDGSSTTGYWGQNFRFYGDQGVEVVPTSLFDNVSFLRGGRRSGSACDVEAESPAFVLTGNSRVSIEHSAFNELDCSAIRAATSSQLNVSDTVFDGQADSTILSDVYTGTFSRNIFSSTKSYYTFIDGGYGARIHDLNFRDNVLAGKVVFAGADSEENRPESMTFRGNSLVTEPTYSEWDYRYNYWGRELDNPGPCYQAGMDPAWRRGAQADAGTLCSAPGLGYNLGGENLGFLNKIKPTIAPPPPLRVGLESAPVSAQLRVSQQFGSGGEFGSRASGEQSDPVNSATGSYVETQVDASVANVGYPLAFGRTYNSADSRVGLLGKGWTASIEQRLDFADATHATLLAGDGQRLEFTKNGSAWVGAPGVTASLRDVASGFEVLTRAQVTYAFDSLGRVRSVKDRNGQGVTYGYTGNDITSATSSGRTLTFAYTGGRLVRVTLEDGRHVDLAYSSDNLRLTSVTDMAGSTVTYGHDASARIITEQVTADGVANANPSQHTITMMRLAYDSTTGRVSDQWDALGHRSTFAWDPVKQVSTMTAPDGGKWIDDYSGSTLFARIDPLGRCTFYDWDQEARLTQVTGPRGDIVEMKYDKAGDLIKSSTPTESITTTYNNRHDPVDATSDAGITTHFEYDTAGNNITATTTDTDTTLNADQGPNAGSSTIKATYYANGQVKDTIDAAGKTTHRDYNSFGDLTGLTTPEGRRSTYGYDTVGRHTTTVDPRAYAATANPSQTVVASYTTTVGYNARDQIDSITDPLGNATTVTFNNLGQVATTIDANNNATAYTYDDAGNTTKIVEPGTQTPTTRATYDDNGNVEKVTDPDGRDITYVYDKANQVRTETGPLGTSTYTYDAAGNLATATQPGRGTIKYRWNQAGEPLLIDYPTSADVNYRYDGRSRLRTMSDGAGTETWTWDNFNRPRTVVRATTIDGATTNGTTSYDYNVLGQIKSSTSPGGARSYTYDDDGLLKTVSGTSTTPLVTYTYDRAGNPTQAANGDGSTSTRTYDNAGRLFSIKTRTQSGTVTLDDTYTLDAVGNPKVITHAAGSIAAASPGTIDTYRYDARDQLTDVCYAATSNTTCSAATASNRIHWEYTPAGNRTLEAKTNNGTTTTTTSTYDAPSGRLASTTTGANTTNYTYDAASRLTGDGTTTYTYNDDDRLRTQTAAGITTTHTYDGNGRRLRSGATSSASNNFWWDPLSYQLTAETTNTGTLTRAYTNGLGPVGFTTSTNATPTNGNWYHQDLQGSTRAVTNSSGAISATASYEPYGVPRGSQQLTTDPKSPLGWAGEYTDPDTTSHLRARQYNPKLGAFVVPDPAKSTAASATYTYANNNPFTNSDPSGLSSISDAVEGIVGAGDKFVYQPIVSAFSSISNAIGICSGNTKGSCVGAIAIAALNTVLAVGTVSLVGGLAAFTLKSVGGLVVKGLSRSLAAAVEVRAGRQAYVDSARAISENGLARIAAGEAPDVVARSVVNARNALKVQTRQSMPRILNTWAERRNVRHYGNPVGPTYESLISRPGVTDIRIIERAGRTSSKVNKFLGVQ